MSRTSPPDSLDIDKFVRLIDARKREIEEFIDSGAASGKAVELDQSRVGRLTRMDAIQQQQMTLESRRRWHRELAALDAVSERIQEGEFGLCSRCGEDIDPRRLEIDLCATLCIECAKRGEQDAL